VAPIPLLVVHGDHDRYFPIDHGLELAAAAGPTSRLWLEPGFGHAEASISRDLTRRIAAWAQGALAAAPVDAAIVDLTEPEVPWPTG
jgi:pimeloyl-ACP methyl ester carboxylesterase